MTKILVTPDWHLYFVFSGSDSVYFTSFGFVPRECWCRNTIRKTLQSHCLANPRLLKWRSDILNCGWVYTNAISNWINNWWYFISIRILMSFIIPPLCHFTKWSHENRKNMPHNYPSERGQNTKQRWSHWTIQPYFFCFQPFCRQGIIFKQRCDSRPQADK